MNKLLVTQLSIFSVIAASAFYFYQGPSPSLKEEVKTQPLSVEQKTEVGDTVETFTYAETKSIPLSASQPTHDIPSEQDEVFTLPDTNPDYGTFGNRYTEITARRDGREIDPQAILDALKVTSAWEPNDDAANALELTDEELTDGREFITFNPMKLESLVSGDSFEISLSQTAKTYTVTVEEVRSDDDGRNVTWRGRLDGVDGFNTITMTRGEDLVVGGITTPEGHFQIQVHGENGWIANSATLFKGVDQQVIVPPEYIENPPQEVVYLPAETFGEMHNHKH